MSTTYKIVLKYKRMHFKEPNKVLSQRMSEQVVVA